MAYTIEAEIYIIIYTLVIVVYTTRIIKLSYFSSPRSSLHVIIQHRYTQAKRMKLTKRSMMKNQLTKIGFICWWVRVMIYSKVKLHHLHAKKEKVLCCRIIIYIYDQLIARLGYTHTYVCIGRVRSFFFFWIEEDNIILSNLFKRIKKNKEMESEGLGVGEGIWNQTPQRRVRLYVVVFYKRICWSAHFVWPNILFWYIDSLLNDLKTLKMKLYGRQ